MKKNNFFLAILSLALILVSCQPEAEIKTTVVDFEDVTLNSQGVWNGSDNSGSFTSKNSTFINEFDSASWNGVTSYFWSGFACSAKKDSVTPGYDNEFSVMAGAGASNSKQFALAYNSASFTCVANADGNFSIKSCYITNSTWAYIGMKTGDYGIGGVGKKFTTDDWFKVVIKGYKSKVLTSSVDVYLADFRSGKSVILKDWTKVDLSSLGQVDSVAFTFDSTDKFGEWLNTPAYACIDNITFEQEIKE